MRWDAAIFGRLIIPAAQRKAWLAAELDWKAVEGHEVLKGYIGGESVRDIVEDVNFSEPSEFLDISWSGDELRLTSFQSQAGFKESMVGFAAAWAASARFGSGELIGMGMVGARFGYRVRVADGGASIVAVAESDLAGLVEHPDAVALRARMVGIGGVMGAKVAAALEGGAFISLGAKAGASEAASSPKKAASKKASAKKAAPKKAAPKKGS